MGPTTIAEATPVSVRRFALTTFLLYIAPVLLISGGLVAPHWRFHVLMSVTIAASVLSYVNQDSLDVLGVKFPAMRHVLIWTVLPLAAGLALTAGFSLTGRISLVQHPGFFVFFVFVSAPAQEFLYRSFLFRQMDGFGGFGPSSKIVFSAALFSFMHLVYGSGLTLILTFLIGAVWAAVFHYTRNLAVVAVSHAAVGAVAIFLGVI